MHNAFLVTRFFRWVWLYIQTANHLYIILQVYNKIRITTSSVHKRKTNIYTCLTTTNNRSKGNLGSLFLFNSWIQIEKKEKRMSTTQVELTWKAPHPPSLAPDLWRENEVLLSPKSTCGPNRLKFHSVSSLRTFFSKYALMSLLFALQKYWTTGQGFSFLNNGQVFQSSQLIWLSL